MSSDTRTDAEKRYDDLKSGAAYFTPAQPDADDPTRDLPLLPEEEAILDILDPWHTILGAPADLPDDKPFGKLSSGAPITGSMDSDGGRSGVVTAHGDGWHFCVDDAGYIAGGYHDTGLTFEDVTIAQLRALGALIASGAFEQLYQHAIAWGRGDDTPPAV